MLSYESMFMKRFLRCVLKASKHNFLSSIGIGSVSKLLARAFVDLSFLEVSRSRPHSGFTWTGLHTISRARSRLCAPPIRGSLHMVGDQASQKG